jgi:hypothetical protein
VLQEIERLLRAAGNNPYRVQTSDCPAPGTAILAIRLDPNGNGVHDDIRLQMDTNPANGLIGGSAGNCVDAGEDVTIARNPGTNAVTVLDNNLGGPPRVLTDAVVTGLEFVLRSPDRTITSVAANVAFIETRITVQGRTPDVNLQTVPTYTLSSEVRVRSR